MPEQPAYWEALLEDVYITIGLAVLAALLGTAAWGWLRWPKQVAAQLALDGPKARADVEDNYRKTVGQALGGVAVLIGAASAYWQFLQQQQTSSSQFLQQQRASHDLLISNQVSKGFEQLGSKEIVIRLGGIYALEGVMNSSDQYHQPVLEALSAFVREGAKLPTTPPPPGPPTQGPPTDIQAALTVIGRRSAGPGVVDLTKANIAGAELRGNANLTGAVLTGARLTGAVLAGARLDHANLVDADLTGASLDHASLNSAGLAGAQLVDARLTGANLGYAFLSRANLARANLTDANLIRASLDHANLTGAVVSNTNLVGTDLTGADLTGAKLAGNRGLEQKQLDGACGSDVELPRGLTLKKCPSQQSSP